MMRKIVLFAAIVVAFAACNNQPANKKDTKNAAKEAVKALSIDQFFEKPDNLIGEKIIVQGDVEHVCRHGGKRMMLVGSKPENRLKVTTGEDIPSFDVAYEGSKVTVTGQVEMLKMDSAYLANWEQELREGAHEEGSGHGDGTGETKNQEETGKTDHEHDHSSHGEEADMGEHIPGMEKVEKYRKQLKETDKDYIPLFSVVADEVNEKE